MTGLEIWLLAVGLAMDCFAISIASGILLKRTLWRPMLTMAFFFGLFQAIMPLLGWIGASTFSHLIESLDIGLHSSSSLSWADAWSESLSKTRIVKKSMTRKV